MPKTLLFAGHIYAMEASFPRDTSSSVDLVSPTVSPDQDSVLQLKLRYMYCYVSIINY